MDNNKWNKETNKTYCYTLNINQNDFNKETTTVWDFPDRGNWSTHTSFYRGNWSPRVVRNKFEKSVANDKNGLSPDEMMVIDEIVAKYMDVSDEELKSMVMDDTPFIASGDCQALNYGLAYYRTKEMSEGGDEDD